MVGEPTELKFAVGHKGAFKISLVSHGIAAHSGYPEMGKCAIEPLLDVLNDLRNAAWPEDELLGMA